MARHFGVPLRAVHSIVDSAYHYLPNRWPPTKKLKAIYPDLELFPFCFLKPEAWRLPPLLDSHRVVAFGGLPAVRRFEVVGIA